MNNLTDKILEKIKDEKIMPKAHWRFLAWQALIWGAAIFIIILSGLAASAIIFNIEETDWAMRSHLSWSFSHFLLMNIPYFWVLLLILFILLAYYAFKHTKKGYRYTLPLAILGAMLLSISFGFAAHRIKGGRIIEERAMRHFPYYCQLFGPRQMIWVNPEKGFLAGKVISNIQDNTFELSDIKKKVWSVNCGPDCVKHELVVLEKDGMIKIIGVKINENSFEAVEIRPFFGKFEMMNGEVRGRRIHFIK